MQHISSHFKFLKTSTFVSIETVGLFLLDLELLLNFELLLLLHLPG